MLQHIANGVFIATLPVFPGAIALMQDSGVRFEYGTLREAIVGRAEGFRIPRMSAASLAMYRQIVPASAEFIAGGQGRQLCEYAPDIAAELTGQIEGLVRLLERHDVRVHRPRLLTPSEQLFPTPGTEGGSLFYMRDPLLAVGDLIIDLAMRFPFRRRQRFAVRAIIERAVERDGRHFISMPEPVPVGATGESGPEAFLEGGDVLVNGGEIYVGISGHASSLAGARWLQRTLGDEVKVHPVALAESIQHLDCALSLPRPGLAIACRAALPDGLPGELRDWDVIDVSIEDAQRLACNGLVLDKSTYVIDRAHAALADRLAAQGLEVIAIPFRLPALFGGGLRCAHHPLRRIP
jgi:N-dimethylarginine dimethylaminohydrolase